jgi:FkbM family methyltransferase
MDRHKIRPLFIVVPLALVVVLLGVFFLDESYNFFRPRYIFVDGGAHIGESIADFVKSKVYSKYSWEMFSFEANHNLIPSIPKRPNLTILNKAIWIHDEGVNFYLGEDTLSSSIIKHKKTGNLSKVPTHVESVDFGKWLKSNFEQDDIILVKLDIEGAEYDVLEQMLMDGSIKYIDVLFVEFHNIKVNVPKHRDAELINEIAKLGIIVKIRPLSHGHGNWFVAAPL